MLAIRSDYYRLAGWAPAHEVYYPAYTLIQLDARTDYKYNADDQLTETGQTDDQFKWLRPNAPDWEPGKETKPRVVVSNQARDAMGRVTVETSAAQSTNYTLNTKNQVTQSTSTQGGSTTTTNYDYGTGSAYALGQLVSATSTQGASTQTTTNSYGWYDGAVLSGSIVTGTGQSAPGTSTLSYDAFGLVTGKSFTGGTSGSVNFVYDAASQGIASSDSTSGTVYEDRWYRMGGVNMWHYSNRYNLAAGDASIVGSRYTVKGGDTLQSVALTLWGDGSLWYKLAEANGLSAGAALSEGQSLIVPSGVWRNSQNAATYTPYDAGRFIGPVDASPSYPAPPKSAKCGVFGQILLVAIAVAVTIIATPAAGATFGQVLLGAAAGSIASQGVGLITGIQDKFSFKSLALSVVAAGVGYGIGQAAQGLKGLGEISKANTVISGAEKALGRVGSFLSNTSSVAAGAVRGAISSTLSQGISVATGLQKSFSWTSVAAAGIGAGLAGAASRRLADLGVTGFGNDVGSTMADTIAQAATRSALGGNSFGDNLIASLPSALGNLAGRALAAGVGTAFDGKGGYISRPEYPEGKATPQADFAINTEPRTSLRQIDPDHVLGVTRTTGGSPSIIVTGSTAPMTPAERVAYKQQIAREEADYLRPSRIKSTVAFKQQGAATEAAINTFTKQPMSGVSDLPWEQYIYALSDGNRGTGALDGSLKSIFQNGGSIERVAEGILLEIVQSAQNRNTKQNDLLSDAGVGSLIALKQDPNIDAFNRLDNLSLSLRGRLGVKEADLFPYAQHLSGLLEAKIDELSPGHRSISRRWEGIESDSISDLPLIGGLSLTANVVKAVGQLATRELAVRSMVPAAEVALPRTGVEIVGKELAGAQVKGFESFSALKRFLGPPGSGNHWHHIVEQTPGNIQRFGAKAIQSTDNVVAIPAGVHTGRGSISAYYSSIQPGTNSMTVRQWLSTQSLEAQRQYGSEVLKRFRQ